MTLLIITNEPRNSHSQYIERHSINHEEILCLAKTIWGEASSEAYEGQLAVGAWAIFQSQKAKQSLCKYVRHPWRVTSLTLYEYRIDRQIVRHRKEWLAVYNMAERLYKDPSYKYSAPIHSKHTNFLTVKMAVTNPPYWFRHMADHKIVGNHVFCRDITIT